MKYSLRTTSHISGVRSRKKKKNQNYTKEFRRPTHKWEQKAKKGSEPQPGCLALKNIRRKRTLLPPRHWGYQSEGLIPDKH